MALNICSNTRRVWRYQRGNQIPYIEDGQTTQWPKEKGQKDKQRSTKHTYKTKDRVTRTPLISLYHCHNTMSERDHYEGCFRHTKTKDRVTRTPLISLPQYY